jgi:hypothetical protein
VIVQPTYKTKKRAIIARFSIFCILEEITKVPPTAAQSQILHWLGYY